MTTSQSHDVLVFDAATLDKCRPGLRKAAELLLRFELLPDHARLCAHPFSGRRRLRIAIARVLALEPEPGVCDEASAPPDLFAQTEVIAPLDRLREELGIIVHDLPAVPDFASCRVAAIASPRPLAS